MGICVLFARVSTQHCSARADQKIVSGSLQVRLQMAMSHYVSSENQTGSPERETRTASYLQVLIFIVC